MKNPGLSERLICIRESLRKNKKEMSTTVGVHHRAWEGYEAGKNIPGGDVFMRIADLGFDTNWLLTGKGEMRGALKGAETNDCVNDVIKALIVVEMWLSSQRRKMEPDRKAQAVRMVYKVWSEMEHADDPQGVLGSSALKSALESLMD